MATSEKKVKVNLRRTYVYQDVSYGPGETEIPAGLAATLGVNAERPVSDESRETTPPGSEETPESRSARGAGGTRKTAAKGGRQRGSARKAAAKGTAKKAAARKGAARKRT